MSNYLDAVNVGGTNYIFTDPNAVYITGDQTISGYKHFAGSTTLDDATIGNLIVTGGSRFVSTINGNITSADKLSTARTISLTGDITGSGTFDGSGNLSIATTKNHTHTFESITNKISANEFNFVDSESATIWFNYRRASGTVATTPTTQFNFTQGTKSQSYAYLLAEGYRKNGSDDSHALTGAGGHRAITDSYDGTSTNLVTGKAVKAALDTLPTPMQFQGSVGSGGTKEWSGQNALPAASTSNKGHTYKVITDHSADQICEKCEAGDTIVSNGTEWVVIPSGDEPSGTVTSVGLSVPTGFSVSHTPVTSADTIELSYAPGYSLPTDTKQSNWDTAYGWGDHAGLYLPLTGGTMTGALTTPSLTVTGASSFSQAINGSILGNAATASRLQNARTISLTGNVTGSGTFDGSGNLSISTIVNGGTATNLSGNPSLQAGTSDTDKITVTAGNKTSAEFTVPYATNAKRLKVSNLAASTDLNTCTTAGSYVNMATSGCASMVNGPSDRPNGEMRLDVFGCENDSSAYLFQQYWARNGSNFKTYLRTKGSSSWSDWYEIIHSGNYTNYLNFTLGSTLITTGNTYTSISGPFSVLTSPDESKAFSIMRSNSGESVKHWIDDVTYHIDYTNDETTNKIQWRFINTDIESPHTPSQASDTSVILNSDRNFYPSVTDTGSIGISTKRWNTAHLKKIYTEGILSSTAADQNINNLWNTKGTFTSASNLSVNYANSAGQVTVSNNDSNASYKMVWHSGNSLYSTADITCNPSTDEISAKAVRAKNNDLYVGSASGSQCHQVYDSVNKVLKFLFD